PARRPSPRRLASPARATAPAPAPRFLSPRPPGRGGHPRDRVDARRAAVCVAGETVASLLVRVEEPPPVLGHQLLAQQPAAGPVAHCPHDRVAAHPLAASLIDR